MISFREYVMLREGLYLPDRPPSPGMPRLNVTPFTNRRRTTTARARMARIARGKVGRPGRLKGSRAPFGVAPWGLPGMRGPRQAPPPPPPRPRGRGLRGAAGGAGLPRSEGTPAHSRPPPVLPFRDGPPPGPHKAAL